MDLTAGEGAEPTAAEDALRRTPRGELRSDLTADEQRWLQEEKKVREWALANPQRWQTMPPGTGDDGEAFERFVYLQTAK
eukprot:14433065-Alexandrium_andersonii.AAC.1